MADFDWVDGMKEKLKAGMKDAHIEAIEEMATKGPQPYDVVVFEKTERPHYIGEVGRKGTDFIYHFYPKTEWPEGFEDKMGEAFLEVFKFPERCAQDFVPELNSWAVRVSGVSDNPFVGKMLSEVFNALDERLS